MVLVTQLLPVVLLLTPARITPLTWCNNFLGEEHTVEHMRDSYWMSSIFNRDDWSNWVSKGSKDIYDRAHEFVETVTEGYQKAEPVRSPAVCEELDRIVREAYAEIESRG